MIFNQTKKILFFHIPKTAGSSMRKLLTEGKDLRIDYNIKDGHPYHVKQKHVRNYLSQFDLTGYKEFTIIREPLERLISMYNHGRIELFGDFYKFAIHVSVCYNNPVTNHFYHSQLDWIKEPITDNINVHRFEEVVENLSVHESKNEKKFAIEQLTDKEYEFCMDFLSEEYEILGYSRKK
jgi:hypothetical protein